jgi:elongation factor Ts
MPTMADIKALRERTGAGIMDCKTALVEAGDDVEGAIDWLRTKGIAKAAKKSSRVATEGLVHSYIHAGGKVGVMVEINCETDFAAKNDQFKSLVHDIALHIAFAGPEYISSTEVDASMREREQAVQLQRVLEEGKPAHIAEKIVEGRMKKWLQEICLLDQAFVKDDKRTVGDVLTAAVATIGENIQVRRFVRFNLGEGLAKKEDNFAAEVAAMTAQA